MIAGFKKRLKALLNYHFIKKKQKVFCISIQRTGTTSVGDFLEDHGFRVARYSDSRYFNWSHCWHIGDYERIFKSIAFNSFQAFEDDPWWLPDFYKVLFHRFPEAKFILFYRDSNKWFDSLLKHSGGKILGNTHRHCKVYRRLSEYYSRLDNDVDFNPTENQVDNLLSLDGKREHYKTIYEENNREVIDYFKRFAPQSLFVAKLEDTEKWIKLGQFLGVEVELAYNVHSNKSQSILKNKK